MIRMSDEQIIKAIRECTHVLLPVGSHWSIGRLSVAKMEPFNGKDGLVIVLDDDKRAEVMAQLSQI